MLATSKPDYDEVGLSSHSFWAKPARERDEAFAELRRERPISWQPPAEGALMEDPDDEGYWAVVRHEDVVTVSKAHEVFSSAPENGGVMFENVPAQFLEETQSILAMDEPRHTVTRRLVGSAFNPRQIRKIEEQIRNQASSIVTQFIDDGPRDFVEQVSLRLPLWTISEMLGVPEEERERVVEGVDGMVGLHDPEFKGEGGDPLMALLGGIATLHDVAQNLIDARRSKAEDDLMTALVQAELDGQKLSDDDIRSYFVLLAVAGNDTTRNTASHAMKALTDFPDQRKLLISDFDQHIGPAIEEFIRWGSAVMTFRRTATEDFVLNGQPIAKGDKVVMFYSSANRDESVFADPWTFDITRNPNPHVGFGGGGVHFCLGNHVARLQLRALFSEILTRVPDLTVSDPQFVVGHFMNAIKRMPASA